MINRVAAAVGPGHRVDLTNYDLLILVDIYRVRCRTNVSGKGAKRRVLCVIAHGDTTAIE